MVSNLTPLSAAAQIARSHNSAPSMAHHDPRLCFSEALNRASTKPRTRRAASTPEMTWAKYSNVGSERQVCACLRIPS